jgi:1-acyl-sn-glycerol-3-phosphate acyltransferase
MEDDITSSSREDISITYRFFRLFFRFLTNIWFREVDMVDNEQTDDRGVLFITWHPNGLIDPMVMTSRLNGKLTTLVQHSLFRIPFIGFFFRMAGVVALETTKKKDGPSNSVSKNDEILKQMAHEIANGGQVLMFPEENTHGLASVQKIRSGAARIMLQALQIANEMGRPEPRIIPVGLHYSDSSRFRERAAIVLERPMDLPALPAQPEQEQLWVDKVTAAIETELKRANLSKTSWEERTLIWKGRSVVYAEKQRQSGDSLTRLSYAESILGARRLRAGWEYMMQHEPEQTQTLASECEEHFRHLERLHLTPYDVDARPEHMDFVGLFRIMALWLWSVVWMFGLVTWGAMIGNYLPYKFQGLLQWFTKKAGIEDSLQGSIKVLSSMFIFPLWWATLSVMMAWLLLDDTSPIFIFLSENAVLKYVTTLPSIGIFLFFFFFWPLTAKAHMKLYARFVRSTRRMTQWKAWKNDSTDWDLLISTQQRLALRLVNIGADLVLPGDEEWIDPPAGQDDAAVVKRREKGVAN